MVLQPHDPPRSHATLDPKPPHHKSNNSIPRYNVLPETLSGHIPAAHLGLNNSTFGGINPSNSLQATTPQLPLPGPSALAPLPLKTPIDELRALLPPVKHVTKYCEIYHNTCHNLYPVDIGIPHMEELSFQYIHQSLGDRLISHLETRSIEAFRNDAIRVALLCAGVAAGVQVSDLDESSRKPLLRQYVATTMKLLRMADAEANSSIAAYPALLIISRVVQDELEPVLSYTLLGSLQRMAQMYAITTIFTDRYPDDTRHLRTPDNLMRVRYRQEAFLALVLGQSHLLDKPPFPDIRGWTNATYLQCLDVLASISAFCGTENIDREDLLVHHAEAMQSIQPLDRWTLPHLADKANCRNVHELTEFCTLRIHECLVNIHFCQIIMAACRRLPGHEEEYFKTGDVCRTKARGCVDAYLDMLAFSITPLRSWILTIAALRGAMILGVLHAELPQSIAETVPDRDRLTKLLQAFTNIHDEAQADRSRWCRRYRAIFDRLRDMVDRLVQSESRSLATNGAASNSPEGTALRFMSRDDRDNIMMPQRMVQHYLASPSTEEPAVGSLLLSQQSMLEI